MADDVRAEFAKNLAILDALDTGLTLHHGTCTAAAVHDGDGCGNQVEYNGSSWRRGHAHDERPTVVPRRSPACGRRIDQLVPRHDEGHLDTTIPCAAARTISRYEFNVLRRHRQPDVRRSRADERRDRHELQLRSRSASAGFNTSDDPPTSVR